MSKETPPYPSARNLLEGRTVVVTAAAGTGIGFAAARRCVEEGARVLISDLHERRLAEPEAVELPGEGFVLGLVRFVADQQHRAPPEPVRQVAQRRREQELHQCEGRGDIPAPGRRLRQARLAAIHQFSQKVGHHRHDQPDAHRVDHHGDQDEGHRRLAPVRSHHRLTSTGEAP